jgi:hypothetical protein
MTAKQFIQSRCGHINAANVIEIMMVEFAKIKVKEAMRSMVRVQHDRASDKIVNQRTEEAIKNFYPLSNIK